MKLNVGKTTNDIDLDLDLRTLIESRMLIQAQSGAGKSWAIRRLLEQSHGQVQQIVIDLEGEFSTLRSRYDYIIASKNGDVQASPKTAALLAQKLMELQVSAICDLYELKAHDRIRFVRLFLESLMMVKKDLWRPILVVIDEAHHFCPEKGQAESAPSVIDLATRGRKRGFCLVAATQRLSKFHKDVCAELGNKLIGRTSLDIDQARAADELGLIGKADRTALRILRPGDFYAYGPAWRTDKQEAPGVLLLKVGPVETHHPKVGARFLETPPAPNAKVKDILAKLADLPQEAEEQARTTEDLRKEITDLKRKLTLAEKNQVKPCNHEAELDMLRLTCQDMGRRLERNATRVDSAIGFLHKAASELEEIKRPTPNMHRLTESVKVAKEQPNSLRNRPEVLHVPKDIKKIEQVDGGLSNSQRKILDVMAWVEQFGISPIAVGMVAAHAGYSVGGGAFNNLLSRLNVLELIRRAGGGMIELTDAGRANANPDDHIGGNLLESWYAKVGSAKAKLLRTLVESYPESLSKQELADRIGEAVGGGAFNNKCSALKTLGLVEYPSSGRVIAAKLLFVSK